MYGALVVGADLRSVDQEVDVVDGDVVARVADSVVDPLTVARSGVVSDAVGAVLSTVTFVADSLRVADLVEGAVLDGRGARDGNGAE